MKKIIALFAIGAFFAFGANAQTTAADGKDAASTTGTEVKADVQNPTAVNKTATAVEKKSCAGESSAKSCSKAGESKSCCKAKTGTASATATAGEAKKSCSKDGEKKDCCKKKAATPASGS